MDSLDFSLYDGREHQMRHIPYTRESVMQEIMIPFTPEKENLVFVMEATGIYHARLACWLYEKGMRAAVINPLRIRRYAEMKLMRIKSDAGDARLIAEYGFDARELPSFQPPNAFRQELELLLKESEALQQEKVRTRNRLHALQKRAGVTPRMIELMNDHLQTLQAMIDKIEKLMQTLLKKHFSREYQLLRSISAIGLKTGSAILSIIRLVP